MLKMQIIGNVGKDAIIRQVQSGDNAISFSVCHTESYRKQSGEKVEKNVWVDCTIWRTAAQGTAIAQYIKKGGKVFLEGEPGVNPYIDAHGAAKAGLTLRVINVELLGSAPGGDGNHDNQGAPQQQGAASTQSPGYASPTGGGNPKDDLPF